MASATHPPVRLVHLALLGIVDGTAAEHALLEGLLAHKALLSRGVDVAAALSALGLDAREASLLSKHPKHLARLSLLIGVAMAGGDAAMVAHLAQCLADKRQVGGMLVLVRSLRNQLMNWSERDAQLTPRVSESANLENTLNIFASELCAQDNHITLAPYATQGSNPRLAEPQAGLLLSPLRLALDRATLGDKWCQLQLVLARALEMRKEGLPLSDMQARASTQPRASEKLTVRRLAASQGPPTPMEARLVKLLDSQHKAQLAQHSLTQAAVAGSLQVSLAASRREHEASRDASRREHQAARDEAQRQHEADMRSARRACA